MLDVGGTVANRFEVLARVGRGGMGEVYRALDRATGATVALKVQTSDLADVTRFLTEARVLAGLEHDAIVRYVAHGVSEHGAPYFAMQWLDGGDLGALLRARRLSAREALALGRRVAAALEAAHAGGVLHRDVKPANVMLPGGEPARAVLVDFGIARSAAASRAHTRTGAMIGTLGYMAPEQLHGVRDIDARVDVFGLGCVLFEALAGRPAFVGDSLAALLSRVLLEEPPTLREFAPHAPEPFAELVQRCLARDRAQRPASAAAVREALDAMSVDEPEGAGAGDTLAYGAAVSTGARPASVGLSRERTPAALVLALSSDEPAGGDATLAAEQYDTQLREAQQLATKWGARSATAVGGALLLGFVGGDGLRARVTAAARAALELREALPTWAVSLSVTHAEGEALALGEARSRMPSASEGSASGTAGDDDPAVRIDDVAAALLDASFLVRGREGALRLEGYAAVREGEAAVAGRGLPCVGREKELRLLEATLAECEEEESHRAVLVLAPSGLGKSRLRREFVARARASGVQRVLFARGEAGVAASPLSLLRQWLGGAAGLEALASGARREALAAHLRGLDASLAGPERFEFAAELAGAPVDEDNPELRATRADPREHRAALVRVLGAWLAREAAAGTTLLTADDLQWADAVSLGLLCDAWRALEDAPLLLVGTAWDELEARTPALLALKGATVLRLDTLGRKVSEKLARAALGAEADARVVARVVELSGGQPFLLEELVRHAARGGSLDAPPGSAVAAVQARLLALPQDLRAFLRAASVFGERFELGGVGALLGGALGSTDPRALCERLVREELVLLDEAASAGLERYRFAHLLVRQAAYETLPLDERRAAHAAVAAYLRGRSAVDPLALAGHLELAGAHAEAAQHLDAAAEEAYLRAEYAAAIELCDRAFPHAATSALVGSLGIRRIFCLIQLGRMHEVGEYFASFPAERLAPNTAEWVAFKVGQIGVLMHTGATNLAFDELEVAFSLPVWPAPTADWGQTLGLVLATLGHTGHAALARIGIAAALAHDADPVRHGAYLATRDHYVSWSLLFLDEPGALPLVRSTLAQARRSLRLSALHGVLGPMAGPLAELGLRDEAHALVAEVRGLAREDLGVLDWLLAGECMALGLDEPCEDLTERAKDIKARGWLVTEGSIEIAARASAALSRPGDAAAAEAALASLAELEPTLGAFETLRAHLYALSADVAWRGGDAARAEAFARKTLAQPDVMLPSDRTRARLVLVKALRARGALDEAARELAAARARLERFAAGLDEPAVRDAFLALPQVAETLALALAPA